MRLHWTISLLILSSLSWAQPVASAQKLGVEVRYFIEFGGSFGMVSGDFQDVSVDVPETKEELISAGKLTLPNVNKHPGMIWGLGAQIDRLHEISIQYHNVIAYSDEDWSLYLLKINYRYLFLKQFNWKPFLGLGFNYTRVSIPDGYVTSDRGLKYQAEGVGKGVQINTGYGAFYKHIGWITGAGYEFASYDTFAIEDDNFELDPGAHFNRFYLFTTLRFYY